MKFVTSNWESSSHSTSLGLFLDRCFRSWNKSQIHQLGIVWENTHIKCTQVEPVGMFYQILLQPRKCRRRGFDLHKRDSRTCICGYFLRVGSHTFDQGILFGPSRVCSNLQNCYTLGLVVLAVECIIFVQ
jgi:hypothetical protein